MIEEYVPPDHQNDDFYERFMEQRARDLKNPSTTDEHDSFSFPVEPLQSTSSKDQSIDLIRTAAVPELTLCLLSFRSPTLSPATPVKTSTPRPSISQYARVAQLSPKGPFSPIQQFIRNSAKLRLKKPK